MFRRRLLRVIFCATALTLSAFPLATQAAADATTDMLRDLLRFDTSNAPGDTRAAADYLKRAFDAAGIPNEIIVAPNGKAAHFIARLKGDGRARPVLIAAHTDVVPVQRERWSIDPFAGEVRDGFIYGRGALDNKGAVAAFAQAVIRLSKDPAPRSRDVIFLAEADEEQGQFNTTWLAANHWEKIDAEFALNEGGRTLVGPDGRVRELHVSYADKLTLNLKIKTRGPTGHSSRPLPLTETANGQLIAALSKLQAYESDIELTPAIRDYLQATAKLNPGPLAAGIEALLGARDAGARRGAAARVIAADSGGWGLEGLMRNTLVITMINSGMKPNVIPGDAEAVMNARLLPGQTVEAYIATLTKVIDNPKVEIEIINARPKAELAEFYRKRSQIAPSPLNTVMFTAIEASARKTWPEVTILPTLLVASTDATPWRERGIPVYGLGPLPVDRDSATRIHGDDERVSVEAVRQGAAFAFDVLKEVTAP